MKLRNACAVAAGLVACASFVAGVAAKDVPAVAGSRNSLLAPWTGGYGGVLPGRMNPAEFPEAFEVALAEQRREIEAIANNPAPPTFENTIEALERAGQARERVSVLFDVVRQNMATPESQTIERQWRPKLAAADDAITFNPALFARVEAVYKALPRLNLSSDQKRLVERIYDQSVRRGVRLDAAEKDRLSQINQELAAHYAEFRAHVMGDENTSTVLESQADLAGLPDWFVASAKAAADQRGLAGKWAVVNSKSVVDPFLSFSSRRDLRERVWKAFKNRGDNGNANDNKDIAARIVALRVERAGLLGYPTHANARMADTMAFEPATAQALLMKVWPAAVARVKQEVADAQAVAATDGFSGAIEQWDYLYYAEKVRKARYDLDQTELKPYFELNNMIAAAMWVAERNFDLTFTEITGKVPVYHPDVRVWEAKDSRTGKSRGVFYMDNFVRTGKRSGAWTTHYRPQSRFDGAVTAVTSNNNNFVKGAAGEPVLMSLDDARTLFHEFGHAMHALLQDIRYPRLSITPRDFVEYPAQVMQQWLLTNEVLDRFARHYKTGEAMPQALVQKIHDSGRFSQGYLTVELLASAIVDMELHTRKEPVTDIAAFERDALARLGMPREVAMRHRLPHFDHLFSTDVYSAGYYSYVWSDVMAADTWRAFVEGRGPWDKAVATRLRNYILSDGNSSDRAEAYRKFRRRDPDVRALFEERGFPLN